MAVMALRLNRTDDVANVLARAGARGEIHVYDEAGRLEQVIIAREEIPLGHKVSVRDLAAGDIVHKYGRPIGGLKVGVAAGALVHTHNLASLVAEPQDALAPRPSFDAGELRTFARAAAAKAGAHPEAAGDLADALVEADLRGVETHGLRRLGPYVARLQHGAVDGGARPKMVGRNSVVHVEGRNAVGHHVARVAADAVVAAAHTHGLAVAAVRNSNHFGFAGYYATRIAAHAMVGIVTSNGTPCVAPPGGTRPFFSNDPLAIAAPLGDGGFVELDLATSVTSRARVNSALEHGQFIPEGWAIGRDGRPTRDPEEALRGTLVPMAGERGFALLFALEMLAGLLPDGASADEVASKDTGDYPEGTSHFLLAISLACLPEGEAFTDRLRGLVNRMRRVPRVGGAPVPRYPGERRWALRKARLTAGVPLDPITVEKLRTLAGELGVAFPAALGMTR